jgi:hypothetical protein
MLRLCYLIERRKRVAMSKKSACLVVYAAFSTVIWAQAPKDSTVLPDDYQPGAVEYTRGDLTAKIPGSLSPGESSGGVVRIYQDSIPWVGDNRHVATFNALGLVAGVDYFIHPITDCQSGIPEDTKLVVFPSNAAGLPSASTNQNHRKCQKALEKHLADGGVLLVDMADNDIGGGFVAPGSTGTPTLTLPDPCHDATLTAESSGHPVVTGPFVWDNENIDVVGGACSVAHGNLADGITLPADATPLMTAEFAEEPRPILAEYCVGAGRVILDTMTKEFYWQNPAGNGPSVFMTNLFSYAMSEAAMCGPRAAILRLISQVEDPGLGLSRGAIWVLTGLLKSSLHWLDKGYTRWASYQIDAFIRWVKALRKWGRISKEDSKMLIDSARQIIKLL